MKTVIYHSADFDGIFCREIAKKFLGEQDVQYIGWNFGDKPIAFPQPGQEFVVMDLPIDKPFGVRFEDGWLAWDNFIMTKAERQIQPLDRIDWGNWVWIDHHKSSIESHPKDIPGYRIDGVAACRLAWQWFANPFPNPNPTPQKNDFVERRVSEPLAVRLAGEYDVAGPNANEDALDFQFGLRSTEIAGDEEQLLTIGAFGDSLVTEISERGQVVRAYLDRVESDAAKKAFTVNLDGLKFLATNGSRANCKAFQLAAESTGHDAVMGFFFNGKQWVVSLYQCNHRKDLDLSVIAKARGGGGHTAACGFTCEKLPFI